jgi:hypothetical protein
MREQQRTQPNSITLTLNDNRRKRLMTDTRRTNFEKIATVETYTPYYNPNNDTYQAALLFGDKVFHSDAFYASADSARRQSRKIVQAIQMACKGKGKNGGGKGK